MILCKLSSADKTVPPSLFFTNGLLHFHIGLWTLARSLLHKIINGCAGPQIASSVSAEGCTFESWLAAKYELYVLGCPGPPVVICGPFPRLAKDSKAPEACRGPAKGLLKALFICSDDNARAGYHEEGEGMVSGHSPAVH